jgi:hypothetical protein
MHLHRLKEEQKIIAMIREKDPHGMKMLCNGISGPVYGIMLRFANGDEKLANRLLSATFKKIEQEIDTFKPEKGSFFCWILNTSRCLAKDHIFEYPNTADGKNNKCIFDLMINKGVSIDDAAGLLQVSRMECAAMLRKKLQNLSSPRL